MGVRNLPLPVDCKVRVAWGSVDAGAVPEFEVQEPAVGWDGAEEERAAEEGCAIRHSFSCADGRNIGI